GQIGRQRGRPLNEAGSVSAEVLTQRFECCLVHLLDWVEVDVVQGEASSVLVRNDERRAVYRIFDAEAAADALDQRRLSDAEGAKQKQHVTGLGDGAQL